jgi:hypothetical protein
VVQRLAGALSRGPHRRVIGLVEVRAVHHLEVRTVVDREVDVGHAHLDEFPPLRFCAVCRASASRS